MTKYPWYRYEFEDGYVTTQKKMTRQELYDANWKHGEMTDIKFEGEY